MKVREEIERYASEEDKPVLLWLFDRYHWASEWRMMATCTFVTKNLGSPRVWEPTPTGLNLYDQGTVNVKGERL